ncbi:uncharacterized protein LACBIDRAFT_334602 [Laccaria bicolor S238N-H82]|uniref:Predicted protein n=1 Tax=Laccaria bicolor (strain S238N-H82 / ATCC MYA-4686) TaxID=486041 RepID=B0DZP4_LACBS|nr:uncharacterized protein LACBIDRAFT_334602 [Laccaria bicolor S238N-H82]EDQ99912.1 predicted protein [Laccaria bicolor S238N-H82]|eukprot:XP_001889455.1 predicted protein [Laccaria bicolor S238N-H82]
MSSIATLRFAHSLHVSPGKVSEVRYFSNAEDGDVFTDILLIFRLLLYCLGQEQWTPQDNDFIILVMGMSGAGKSKGRRETATEVGHDLKSCTAKVLPLVINHGPSLGASGCNGDSGRSDAQIRNCINSELLSLWFWSGNGVPPVFGPSRSAAEPECPSHLTGQGIRAYGHSLIPQDFWIHYRPGRSIRAPSITTDKVLEDLPLPRQEGPSLSHRMNSNEASGFGCRETYAWTPSWGTSSNFFQIAAAPTILEDSTSNGFKCDRIRRTSPEATAKLLGWSRRRSLYYRLYTTEGPIRSNNPIHANNTFISRTLITPPRTASSMKKRICKIKGFRSAAAESFKLAVKEDPGLGLSKDDPIVLVVRVEDVKNRKANTAQLVGLPEALPFHYRLYDEEGAMTSKTAFDMDDSSLGRIGMLSIAPPQTLASLRSLVMKIEGFVNQNINCLKTWMESQPSPREVKESQNTKQRDRSLSKQIRGGAYCYPDKDQADWLPFQPNEIMYTDGLKTRRYRVSSNMLFQTPLGERASSLRPGSLTNEGLKRFPTSQTCLHNVSPLELVREIIHLLLFSAPPRSSTPEKPGCSIKPRWSTIDALSLTSQSYRALVLEAWSQTLYIESSVNLMPLRDLGWFPELGSKWVRCLHCVQSYSSSTITLWNLSPFLRVSSIRLDWLSQFFTIPLDWNALPFVHLSSTVERLALHGRTYSSGSGVTERIANSFWRLKTLKMAQNMVWCGLCHTWCVVRFKDRPTGVVYDGGLGLPFHYARVLAPLEDLEEVVNIVPNHGRGRTTLGLNADSDPDSKADTNPETTPISNTNDDAFRERRVARKKRVGLARGDGRNDDGQKDVRPPKLRRVEYQFSTVDDWEEEEEEEEEKMLALRPTKVVYKGGYGLPNKIRLVYEQKLTREDMEQSLRHCGVDSETKIVNDLAVN